jgi:hypothetical protein
LPTGKNSAFFQEAGKKWLDRVGWLEKAPGRLCDRAQGLRCVFSEGFSMYEKILVPVDGSATALAGLQEAIALRG